MSQIYLSAGIVREQSEGLHNIQADLGSYPALQMAATDLLLRSKKFVEGTFRNMSETYEFLNSAFKNPAETWNLVCFSVEQVFMNEFTSPLACMVANDFTEVEKTRLDTVWTNLNIGSVVDSFLAASFKNHASLNGAQIRFILKMSKSGNNNSELESKITSQSREIETLRTLVEEQSKALEGIKRKLSYVEGRADAACNAADVPQGKGKAKGGK